MRTKGNGSGNTIGLYARISLDRQDGEGVDRQLADGRELIAERWPEAHIIEYVDNDLSAFKARQRPEYDRLLTDTEAGRLSAVVAYHPDRLYRHPADLESFIDAVQGAGADVATVKAGDVDLSTASGRMVARILGSVSRHESERIGERVSRAKQERATQGRPAGGGLRPFGLTADRAKLEPAEAEVLQAAAATILDGGSWSKIVRDMNERGIRNVTGNEWTVGNLRRTLTSPHVAGLRAYKGEIVGPATWPAILDRGTWERLRADAATRKRGRPPSDRHLLTGLLTCGRCRLPLWANQTRNGNYAYRCSPSATTKGKGCGRMSISRDSLDALVTAAALATIDSGQLSAAVDRHRQRNEDAPDIEEIEAELGALADDHGAGRITRAEWLRARGGLARRLDEANTALARQAGTLATVDLVDLADRWPDLGTERRREILKALIVTVTINPATSKGLPPMVDGIGRIDPDRVDIEWRV
ncbi:MAG TPA: recombinase family protein [Acidimicrobiales bacterium]